VSGRPVLPGGWLKWALPAALLLAIALGSAVYLVRPQDDNRVANANRTAGPDKAAEVKAWGKEVESSIGMKLVRIPRGTFTMGSPAGEVGREVDEKQHEVEITKEFWLGVHEVTQKQFKALMGFNPSYFSRNGEGKAGEEYGNVKPAGFKDQVPANTDDFPVENVSCNDAADFCKKLSEQAAEKNAGRKYRLPTEAEWEYACRGGAPSYQVFHFGNSLSSTQANFNGRFPYGGADKGNYLGRPCKVGSYAKNGFGLHDMHGNIHEWCADWYDKDYHGKSPRRDPQGPSVGSERVLRGGCWCSRGRDCRSANRFRRGPAGRGHDVGFRVALVSSGR
jgi:formylglycine-generating enzyme required for sulfatase activity